MKDDAELLRDYSDKGSEQAFAELVSRHVGLVYATAMRRTGDSHRAADVTQEVFTNLAKRSRRLGQHTSLAAWLHTATRNSAINLMISEKRRRRHESEAAELALADVPASGILNWEKVRPVLDAAIDSLPEPDRVAIVLRFLKRQSYAAVGATLQLSEDAARMRVDRALDRLRSVLERRGISSSAAALGLLIANQPTIAVPATLAAGVSAAAFAGAGVGIGSSLSTAILLMNPKIAIPTIAAMITLGVAVFESNKAASLKAELDTANQGIRKQTSLVDQKAREVDWAARELERLRAEIERLSRATVETPTPAVLVEPVPPAGLVEGMDVSSKLQRRYPNGVVAVVGSKAILAKDVEAELSPQLISSMRASAASDQQFNEKIDRAIGTLIQDLIDRELIIKEFRKDNPGEEEGRKISDTAIDQQIAETEKTEFGGDHARFLSHIQSLGMSRSEYRKKIEEDIIFRYTLGQLRRPQPDGAPVGKEAIVQRRDALLERLRSEGSVRRF